MFKKIFVDHWDYQDIKDPAYKSEVRTNKSICYLLFSMALIALVAMIFFATRIWKTNSILKLLSCFIPIVAASLGGGIYCYIVKGRQRQAKYILMAVLLIVTFYVNICFTFSTVLFLVVPIICSVRYGNRRGTILVGLITCLIIFLSIFIAPFSAIATDLNVLPRTVTATVKEILEGAKPLDYLSYVKESFISTFLPQILVFIVIWFLCILSVSAHKHTIDETIKVINSQTRIEGELSLANEIQLNMLPKMLSPFPNIDSFDLYAKMKPAKEVGGDLYDFFLVDDQHVALVIADVSGKGVPAALFMAITKTLIKNQVIDNHIDYACEKINNILCDGNSLGLFVTAWIGVLDLNTGKLDYCNCGHNPPILKKGGKIDFLRDKSGIAFGYTDKRKYIAKTLTLEPGDKLFLYTDGVTENMSPNNSLYGENRLKDFLSQHKGTSSQSVVEDLFTELDKFAGGKEQFDDISMLCFSFDSYSYKKSSSKEFEATNDGFKKVSEFVEDKLTELNIPLKVINQMNIAVEEMFTNIVKYAYENKGGKAIVKISFDSKKLSVELIDNGPEFDPLAKEDPDIDLGVEDRPIGGLGIFMVKKLMDEVTYARVDSTNVVTLVKYIH